MKKRKGAKSGEEMWGFGASARSCTFQEVRSCDCCRWCCCSCAALPGPGSPESEIHQGPRQDFISTWNKKGSCVIIFFKRFMVAGFSTAHKLLEPLRPPADEQTLWCKKAIGNLVVPRGLGSWFQLRIRIPVLFCFIHAFFSALSRDSVC